MTLHLTSCVKRDDLETWLREQIEYLISISRTPFGDGTLAAYGAVLREIQGDAHAMRENGAGAGADDPGDRLRANPDARAGSPG